MAKFKQGDKVQSNLSLIAKGEVIAVGDTNYFMRWDHGREELYPIETMDERYELIPTQYIVELRVPQDGEQYFQHEPYAPVDATITTARNRPHKRAVIVGTV